MKYLISCRLSKAAADLGRHFLPRRVYPSICSERVNNLVFLNCKMMNNVLLLKTKRGETTVEPLSTGQEPTLLYGISLHVHA